MQDLYEYVFVKIGYESSFGLFVTMPRKLVTIDSKMTVKELGSCTLAIEEVSEGLRHPVCYISTEVCSLYLFIHFITIRTLQEEENFHNVIERGSYCMLLLPSLVS